MDKNKLLDYLDIAMMSYSDSPTVEDFKIIKEYNNKETGVQYFIGERNGKIILSFRGSDELKDWITNFKFWQKTVPYGNTETKVKIHSGFYEAYQTVRNDILNFFDDYLIEHKVNCIDMVGHSLGGGILILCAVDLQFHHPKIQYNVVTFGCPRVGNKAFAKSYNKRLVKTLRVENGNDIVTKLPFKILGFKHVGIKIHIGNFRLLSLFSVISHACTKYYEILWKI